MKRLATGTAIIGILILVGVVVAKSSENDKGKVVVTDDSGHPLQGAEVEAVSLSINYGKHKTGADGVVVLSTHYGQAPQWLNVQKAGYEPINVTFPTQWPFTIQIKKKK